MTNHTWVDLPDEACTRFNIRKGTYKGCWTCGLLISVMTSTYPSQCETHLSNKRWSWGPGQKDDPFASMRTNTGASSQQAQQGWKTGAGGGGGSITGISASGMPIRRDLPQEAAANSLAAKPKEDIPGITDNGIDKDAYNDFMRNL